MYKPGSRQLNTTTTPRLRAQRSASRARQSRRAPSLAAPHSSQHLARCLDLQLRSSRPRPGARHVCGRRRVRNNLHDIGKRPSPTSRRSSDGLTLGHRCLRGGRATPGPDASPSPCALATVERGVWLQPRLPCKYCGPPRVRVKGCSTDATNSDCFRSNASRDGNAAAGPRCPPPSYVLNTYSRIYVIRGATTRVRMTHSA